MRLVITIQSLGLVGYKRLFPLSNRIVVWWST